MARSAGFNLSNLSSDFSLGRRTAFKPTEPFSTPESPDYSEVIGGVFDSYNRANEDFQGRINSSDLAGAAATNRARRDAQRTLANAVAQADVTSAEVDRSRLEQRNKDLRASIDEQVGDATSDAVAEGLGTTVGLGVSLIPGFGPFASTAARMAGGPLFKGVKDLFS